MKIAFVSTYPPFVCGIADYARQLAREIHAQSDDDLVILSEGGDGAEDDFPVHDTYRRSGDFAADIFARIEAEKPQVVHFQHAPDLFPDKKAFIRLMKQISAMGISTFVTLHTVYETRSFLHFVGELSRYTKFIVHNRLCRQVLARVMPLENVMIIPHGTPHLSLPPKEDARRLLGIKPDDFIFLFFGALHAQKNLHTAIRAFHKLDAGKLHAKMIIAGAPRAGLLYNRIYARVCRMLTLGEDTFCWRSQRIAEEDIPTYLSAADVVLLPYWQNYHSSSGVIHLTMAAGKPVLCSDSPKFSEVQTALDDTLPIFIPTHGSRRWTEAMARMVEDRRLRSRVRHFMTAYGEQTSWKNAAIQHLAAYRQAVAELNLKKAV